MKGFSISNDESISGNIRRILLDQIAYIRRHAGKKQKDIHRSIHEIRKSIKRIRAVLRMVRDEIGYSSYYRENVFYRDLSRKLSEIRNYEVLSDSIHNLQADLSNTIPAAAFKPLEMELNKQREEISGDLIRLTQLLKEISGEMDDAKERIHDFMMEHDDFRALEGGIIRIYRQGRRYLHDIREDPDPTRLHDMRKRMKYFWYQVDLLQPIFPGPMKAYARTLETITESLGVYHDLVVLQEFLSETNIITDAVINETLLQACDAKKSMLLSRIWIMADTAYSEKPRALVDRLASYWKVYASTSDHNH
jgi:CHAD domain-containing protein